MIIRSESFSIDNSEPGFIHIRHVQIKDDGTDIGRPMWFERASLPWVVGALRTCVGTYAAPRASAQQGDDRLTVFESGPEQAPFINLFNERPKAAPHGGKFAQAFSKAVAEQLVDELATVR